MIRAIIAAAVVSLGATVVFAQGDVIAQRRDVMKSVGGATKDPGGMLKGETAFDLAKVQKALATYQDAAKKMPGLFPENSKTGGETTAAPKIWDDMAGFKAAFQKFEADAVKASAEIKDEASFKANFPAVLKNCGGCHESYRVKKS
ncbi:c-type cytochrome [Alsobacter sp. SYSU BS001988]|jgi:cytochrome c556